VPSEGVVSPQRGIYAISVDGRSPAERLALHGDWTAFWSPVSGRVAYERSIDGADLSVWTTAPGEGTSRQILRGPSPLRAALSRDGKWLAFNWTRGDSRTRTLAPSTYIYVSPFRSGGIPTEMPGGDAHNPVWSLTGDELFFEKSGRVLVTRLQVSATGAPTFSEPVTVYDSGTGNSRYWGGFVGDREYDVMPDGGSVLVTLPGSPEIAVVPDISSRRIQ
jgi:hypothetical protein